MAGDLRYPSEMVDRLEDEDEELLKHLVTKEEVQLLDPKHYYAIHYVNLKTPHVDRQLKSLWNSISYPLAVIRKAYINLKLRKEETDILEVLRDKHVNLTCSTACFRSMRDYTVGVREILDSFYQNTYVQAAGFSKPSLPRKFRFKEDDFIFRESKRTRHILLFLKEILSILLGNDQSEVYEGNKRLGTAELMGLVETCVKQLYAELMQEHDFLIRLIRTVHDEYAHNKDVFAAGLAAYQDCNKLIEKLHKHPLNACLFVENNVQADAMMKIFLPVFFSFSSNLGYGKLPISLEGFPPGPACARAPPTSAQMMVYQAYQAVVNPQRFSTLGAAYVLTLTDSQRMEFEALKEKVALQKLSNSPAASYSAELLQYQQRVANPQRSSTHGAGELPTYLGGSSPVLALTPTDSQRMIFEKLKAEATSNSPATSYSQELLQSQQGVASLQITSNSPTTSDSPSSFAQQ